MFFVYILEAEKTGRWYIGMTEDIATRLKEHNGGRVRSTKGYRPYVIVHTEQFPDKMSARKREIQIKKSGVIRKELKSIYGRFTAPSSNG